MHREVPTHGMEWQHVGLRRGGGGGDPVAKPIGVMMILLGVLSLGFYHVKCSNSVAMLIVGLIIGAAELHHSTLPISDELIMALLEIGAVLQLFVSGVAVDFGTFERYWKQVVLVGAGRFSLITLIFALIGHGSGICDSVQSSVFFGLLCAFPSKILVEEALDRDGATNRVYGRISMGVLFSSDLAAVLSFAFIFAFMQSRMPDKYDCPTVNPYNLTLNSTSNRRGGSADTSLAGENAYYGCGSNSSATYDQRLFHLSLYDELGKTVGIFVAVCVILTVLGKFVLNSVFAFFSLEGEMLFIGTVGKSL